MEIPAKKNYVVLTEWGYRGVVEEQYINILWMAETHLRMGVNLTMILKGCAVWHAVRAADHAGDIEIAGKRMDNVCDARKSLREAMAAGVHVCVDRDDWQRLVPPGFELQGGVEPASRQRISGLIESADAAWFW